MTQFWCCGSASLGQPVERVVHPLGPFWAGSFCHSAVWFGCRCRHGCQRSNTKSFYWVHRTKLKTVRLEEKAEDQQKNKLLCERGSTMVFPGPGLWTVSWGARQHWTQGEKQVRNSPQLHRKNLQAAVTVPLCGQGANVNGPGKRTSWQSS